MNQNAKYCTPKLITTSNVTDKERTRVLFVDDSLNFLLF